MGSAPRPGRTSGVVAVIFDLDGVLVDSEPWWAASRAQVARRHGADWTPADEASVKGANSREWAAAMRERLHLDAGRESIEREVVEEMTRRYLDGSPPRIESGIAAVERLSERYPLGLASSAHPDVIVAALGALGLDGVFAAVVSADEVAAGKPAPDVYLEAARRLDVSPSDCVVVEDSASGVEAAHTAGMRVIWVGPAAFEPGARPPEGAIRVESLDRLGPAALERGSFEG